jgi:radical SAM protein with 4Fe4S-binding SPASM domain
LKLESGSHPKLYRIGMKLYKFSPKFWEYGINFISLPGQISTGLTLKLGDKKKAGNIGTVNLELTARCNLRCKMCWWWGENGVAFKRIQEGITLGGDELTTENIFKLVDQLEQSCPSFYLSGGEPFIREDTVEIIEYITRKGMSVTINTNGTLLTNDNLAKLAKIKKLTINFSIDGLEEAHDEIRGKGTFNKTTNNIRELIKLRGEALYPSIKTNTTLFSPHLLGHMDELIRYLQDSVGVDAVSFRNLFFTYKKQAEAHKALLKQVFDIDEYAVDSHIIDRPEQKYLLQLSEEVKRVEKTRYSKPVFIIPRLAKEQICRYYTDLSFKSSGRCLVAWNFLMIKANGDTMFCPDEWMTEYKLGNVKETRIEDMWRSKAAGHFREELYKYKMFPACSRCCMMNSLSRVTWNWPEKVESNHTTI